MTITSNIHVGLTAWSSSTFTLGQRCSAAGNAYQCIVPGTSTATPTGTTASINNGGGAYFKWLSSIDYTTLPLWAASITGTLSQPVVGLIWNNGTITTTAGTAVFALPAGVVTTTVNTVTLTCAPGESFRDKAQGAALAFATANGVSVTLPSAAGGGVNYLDFSGAAAGHCILDGIQIQDPFATSGASQVFAAGSGNIIRNCLFDGYGQAGGISIVGTYTASPAGTTATIENCLFVDRTSAGTAPVTLASNAATFRVANCTFVSIAAYTALVGIQGQSSAALNVTNTIMIGYAAAVCINSSGTQSADHSLFTNPATGITFTNGTGNLFSQTASAVVMSATADFRLRAGSPAIDAGAADATDVPALDDIARVSRPQGPAWDIGCCEYVPLMTWAAAPNQPVPGRTEMVPY